jgi:hypothetical protein
MRCLEGEERMRNATVMISCAVLTLGAAGCRPITSVVPASPQSVQDEMDAEWMDTLREELFPRAAFDLECPRAELQAHCLDNGNCETVGVTGCGKRATYVLIDKRSRGLPGKWAMDAASVKRTAKPSPPPFVPPAAVNPAVR